MSMIKESAAGLTPIVMDVDQRRDRVRQAAIKGVSSIFPIIGTHREIHISNPQVATKDFSYNDHKKALMLGGSLNESLKATVTIKDKKTGEVIDQKKNHTLLRLPHVTNNQTMVVGGNEYSLMHQLRTRPGVYTRRRENQDIEASFNLAKGQNFRMSMTPETGDMNIEYGTTKIPAYSVLRGMGVSHQDIQNSFGKELADRNRDKFDKNRDKHINKLYSKIVPPSKRVHANIMDKQRAITEQFERTQLDPTTTAKTLGQSHDRVNARALLQAGNKILKVYNEEAPEDDRDSLEFQKLVSPEDFIQERLEVKRHELGFKLKNKADLTSRKKVDEILPSSALTPALRSFITTSQLSQLPSQINPVEMLDSAASVTRLGEGGISDSRAVPASVRLVHSSNFGVMDPYRTPESGQIGISTRLSMGAMKDDNGNLYTPVKEVSSGKTKFVPSSEIMSTNVAFPNQDVTKGRVDSFTGGTVKKLRPKDIKYQVRTPNDMYTFATNLVPMIESSQGNRLSMGAKYSTQALSLKEREVPLVQSLDDLDPYGSSMEETVGKATLPTSKVNGTVSKVDKDFIYIKGDDRKTHKVPYASNFPLASKTLLNHEMRVKKGDKVKAGDVLVDSNYTKDGTLALGKNLKVGYMAYHGLNSNDAVVVSRAAANKMTSVEMVKKVIPIDKDTHIDSKKHFANFPKEFTKDQYNKLDGGVIRPGMKVTKGDPIAAVLRKAEPTLENKMFGKIHKSLRRSFSDDTLKWDKDVEGEIVDVERGAKQITVTIKSENPAKIGDKLANRYGGKGVISKIIEDDEMVQDEGGKPLDILWTSVGVVSRINPAQVVESAIAKVADKNGAPIKVPQFNKVNNVKAAKKLLKDNGLKDKETVFDPVTGKKIKGIMVGPQYTYKLFKSTDTNFSARGIEGGYDLNGTPARGGQTGAKGTGAMEINSLLAHDARDLLKENATIRSSRNSEYWRALQLNRPLPTPEQSPVFDKFKGMLASAGLKYNRQGNSVSLVPMTDNEVRRMSSGEVKNGRMVTAKDLSPEKGGLFDMSTSGGLIGNKWSHIELPEPVLNPIFKDASRRLLGKTQKELENDLVTRGGAAVKNDLNNLDIDSKITSLKRGLGSKRGADKDNSLKQIKALRALKKNGLRAGDAYTMQTVSVMPPTMRPIVPSKSGDLLVSDINHLYKDTVQAADAFREAKKYGLDQDSMQGIRKHMQQAVGAVVGLEPPVTPKLEQASTKGVINEITGTKSGFYSGKLVARRLNLTGRGTAAPDPSLGMDEVGLPEEMAWTMYTPFVTKNMVRKGFSALDAKKRIEDRDPSARAELVSEMSKRPVILNRAPTLYKHGLVGSFPKLVSGKTIQVNPFIEKGMNLDYDGDALQVHLPATEGGINDAKKMLVSRNVFADITQGKALATPAMEAVAGMYMAGMQGKSSKATRVFETKGEALAAYRSGSINLNDPVEIRRA